MSQFSRLTQADFLAQVAKVPPEGRAWPRDPDTVQRQVWNAIGDAAWSLHAKAVQFLEQEANPGRAVELLRDWEIDYGLPDPCTPLNPTVGQRQAAVLAKIASQGGQSIAYYTAIAAALGYTITITEYRPLRLGFSIFGSGLMSPGWESVWDVNAPTISAKYFRFGISAFGEPFWTVDNTELECRIRALAPARTIIRFKYS